MNAFTDEELHTIREWFDILQDLTGRKHLLQDDYALAKRVYELLGMRVPDSINERVQEFKNRLDLIANFKQC